MQSNIPINILQSYVYIPLRYIYENLVAKSVGLNLLSLLGFSSSSSVDASSFGFVVILSLYLTLTGTQWCSWLRHCATSWKVAGSIPDGVIGIFFDIILPAALWA